MFEFVRTHNRLLQVLLGLLIFPSFIFFGVQSYSHLNGPDAEEVASVDGKKIAKGEWDAEHRRFGEELRQRNPNLDPKLLDTAEARRRTLDNLVRDRLLQAAVFHQDLVVSDERLTQVITTDPQLQAFLKMDAKTREAVLRAQNMTMAGFEEQLRQDIARRQVLQPVSDSQVLPESTASRALDALLEKREVQYQRFEAKDWLDKVAPTEADAQKYYADPKNAAQFKAPEEARIEYVVLDLAALKSQVSVNEEELRTYYNENLKSFQAAEERRASHILIKAGADASPEAKAKAKAKAEALLAEVRRNPAQFAELAKKNSEDPGSAANGGDLDFFPRGAMVPPFDQAVFSMKEGDISDVVATDFGFHVIRLTGIRGGKPKSFEEVRPQIEDERRKQLAQAKFAEMAEKFGDKVDASTDTLKPVAEAFKLPLQTATVGREPAPGAAGPLASKRLLDAVFSPESQRTKRNTEAIETGTSQLTAARLVEYKAAHQIPLADVKDKVMAAVRQSMAVAAAKKEGEARVEALKKDPAATLPKQGVFSRVERGELAGAALDAALKADLSKGPVATGVSTGDAYVAMRVVKALPRDPADPTAAQGKQFVAQGLGDAEQEAFYNALKARYKVKLDEAAIQRVLAQSGAASSPAP